MPGQEMISLKGEFNCWNGGFDLPDLLLAVCNTGHTGLLRFECAEGEKTLFLRRGEVVFASSSSADDRLGEYLLRIGKITLRDLSQHTHLVQPGKRLGTLLVEGGVLDPKGLVHAVIGQVRAIVLSLFRWTEALYGFDKKDLPRKETITLDMPAARLIMDGLQRIDSWRRVSQGVGEIDSVYRRVGGNEKTLRKLNLDTPTLEVLAILDQARNVAEICDSSPLPDLDVCRYLWAFRCLGWIELADGMPVASVEPAVQSEVPVEVTSRSTEAVPASASLADLADTSVELVSGASSELTDLSGSRRDQDESERHKGIPVVAPDPFGSEKELSLIAPDADSHDASPSPEPQRDAGIKESASSDESVLDTDDADLEGLGMVLGEEKHESETG